MVGGQKNSASEPDAFDSYIRDSSNLPMNSVEGQNNNFPPPYDQVNAVSFALRRHATVGVRLDFFVRLLATAKMIPR